MDREIYPQVFWPMPHLPSNSAWVVVRTKAGTEAAAEAIRRAVRAVDPEIAIVEQATMTNILADSLWRQRFAALLVGLFAALAALITSGGLYAVISYAVARQTRELGVRIALGAGRTQIAATVLGHGLRITAIGIAGGAVLAIPTGRLLTQQVGDVAGAPWMIASVALLLLVMTVIACWIPMRKALRVDPLSALRTE
jgi:putative ABC transport system permease protein